MIRGVHAMFYTSEPEALRSFLRDKLDLASTDVGDGWLIFALTEAEMGCHPADPEHGAPSGLHDISFYCDDVAATVATLRSRGVQFESDVMDMGFGLGARCIVPGGFKVLLYQPRYRKSSKTQRASSGVKSGARRRSSSVRVVRRKKKSAKQRKTAPKARRRKQRTR